MVLDKADADAALRMNAHAAATYEQNRSVWDRRFVMNPDEPTNALPWLDCKRVKGIFVAGCRACAAENMSSPRASYSGVLS